MERNFTEINFMEILWEFYGKKFHGNFLKLMKRNFM